MNNNNKLYPELTFPPEYSLSKKTEEHLKELLTITSEKHLKRFSLNNISKITTTQSIPKEIENILSPVYEKKLFFNDYPDREILFTSINLHRFTRLCIRTPAKEFHQVTPLLIKKMHRIIMQDMLPEDQLGQWRKGDIHIGTESLHRRSPSCLNIEQNIQRTVKWFNSNRSGSKEYLINIFLLMLMLEYIHPFINGNGRTVRALAVYMLYKQGFDFVDPLFFEEAYRQYTYEYRKQIRRFCEKGPMDFSFGLEASLTALYNEALRIKEGHKNE